MANMKQLIKAVSSEYSDTIIKEVKSVIPSLMKSIKSPKKNSFFLVEFKERLVMSLINSRRERQNRPSFSEDNTISKSDIIVMVMLLVIIDVIIHSIIMSMINRLANTKLAKMVGNLIITIAIKIAYNKAGFDQTGIKELTDLKKANIFNAIMFSDIITAALANQDRAAVNTGISDDVNNIAKAALIPMLQTTNIGDIGAFFILSALSNSITVESSREFSQKYNILNSYNNAIITISIASEFTTAVLSRTPLSTVFKNAIVNVLITSAIKMLHMNNLSWAAYIVYFTISLFAVIPTTLLKSKNDIRIVLEHIL